MAKIPAAVVPLIVVAVVSMLGIVLWVMEVRRMRIAAHRRQNDVASPLLHTQSYLVPPEENSMALSPIEVIASVEPTSLMDRMREVQRLMLQIHDMERQPTSSDNQAKIQELHGRITELSDVSDASRVPPLLTPQAASKNSFGQPAPHSLDGRDD
ncbi:hypothetical protein JR316_0004085 [Psilocybe cubensis]|uniref:Uncharacterized protein n=2 Tax=Psilocybe cubensis TaxID=181762 RepID=A0A8H7Y6G0_PSICU|nr:hypothetical protein JR316_0004085 [Psilocybe cubensis]KAH9484603.1 hypothetical protein JR316_0004085 [Psilocybe cubensis]